MTAIQNSSEIDYFLSGFCRVGGSEAQMHSPLNHQRLHAVKAYPRQVGGMGERAAAFAHRLDEARTLAPSQLATYLEQLMTEFPELRDARVTFPVPGGALSVLGLVGQAAQTESAANTGRHDPLPIEPVARRQGGAQPAFHRHAYHGNEMAHKKTGV